MESIKIQKTQSQSSYSLIDSGMGEKLEKFGDITMVRPDPQAMWEKKLPQGVWEDADLTFVRSGERGEWKFKNKVDKWQIDFADLKFFIKPTAFKHVGLFPEQFQNWKWMSEIISKNNNIKVLNLFGYTGGASLTCARAGAEVVHIDSSKSAVNWARENAEISGLSEKPIRWIIEDVRVFVEREIKRGNKYHAIIMDPPAFGHGTENEIWEIEKDLIPLVDKCLTLLSDEPLFFIINGYSSGYSSIAYSNLLSKIKDKFGGQIEYGELTIEEDKNNRLLPCGIFARWINK